MQYDGVLKMKLFFPPADLLLERNAIGEYVLQMKGELVAKFKQEKHAVRAYNRIRGELEGLLPPSETSEQQKRELYQQHINDGLLGHNSRRPPSKKPGKSRTFG